MEEQRVIHLLRDLPRDKAQPGFTARVLRRLAAEDDSDALDALPALPALAEIAAAEAATDRLQAPLRASRPTRQARFTLIAGNGPRHREAAPGTPPVAASAQPLALLSSRSPRSSARPAKTSSRQARNSAAMATLASMAVMAAMVGMAALLALSATGGFAPRPHLPAALASTLTPTGGPNKAFGAPLEPQAAFDAGALDASRLAVPGGSSRLGALASRTAWSSPLPSPSTATAHGVTLAEARNLRGGRAGLEIDVAQARQMVRDMQIERGHLERELHSLSRNAYAAAPTVVYLGGDESVDLIYSTGRPRTGQMVSVPSSQEHEPNDNNNFLD